MGQKLVTDNVDELIAVLAEAASLLENAKETFWSKWLRESLNMIRQRNFQGVERLLSGFGGMGSFNDLVIHPINGHEIPEMEIPKVNDRLARLRSKLYDLAQEIKHDVESE